MALNIKIHFKERYDVSPVNDLQYSVFHTELITGKVTRLGIKISSDEHPLMRDVYNMAFVPVNASHEIDDQAKLTHLNHSKVFSTIVFEGLSFLMRIREGQIGDRLAEGRLQQVLLGNQSRCCKLLSCLVF